jgi:hypothetical protein
MRVKRNSRERNAVSTKSGESVSRSDPGLIGPTLPSTADRTSEAHVDTQQGAKLRPVANHQSKNGREFEGRALIGGEAAAPFTSLDSKQNNRDSVSDPYRINQCGKLTLQGVKPDSRVAKFFRLPCKCWACPRCGPRKARRYRHLVRQAAERYKLHIMLTLTLDPKKLNGEDSTQYINEVFANFRIYMKREFGASLTYVRILEYQQNGNAHFHILIPRFIKQKWISTVWSALGGGKIVDIEHVDMHRISQYLSKYLTKEMLLLAPKRARRVTTSRNIKLNIKVSSEFTWRLIRVPIDLIYKTLITTANNAIYDVEGDVVAFESMLAME